MANTTNYNWETPDDTDLVKDGAAAIRTLGSSVDTTTKALNPSTTLGDIEYRSATANTNTRLAVGTTGQVLTVAGGVPSWATPTVGDITAVTAGTGISGGGTTGDVTITNSMATAIDAKGDLVVGTGADTFSRLAVGTNTYILTADSAEATGLKWAAPSGGASFVGASAIASSNQTISSSTETAILFDGTDLFDTDAYHNPASNSSRMTIPAGKAGKYAVYGRVNIDTTSTSGRRILEVYKNGAQVPYLNIEVSPLSDQTILTAGIISLAESDYIELYFYQTSGISLTTYGGYCGFSIQYLGA